MIERKAYINIFLILVFSLVILSTAIPAEAFTFDKNTIITDGELENAAYLSTKGVQSFLEEKGSILATTRVSDTDGVEKSVASVITSVSKTYELNPMMFLVMAQKESSAITSSVSSYAIDNWILGYGRCDSCSEEQAAPYRGIARQFRSAADRIRNGYLADLDATGTTISGWGVGKTKTTIDGIDVTPSNKATAALYTYNPCVGAYGGGFQQFGCNSAFAKIWQEWNPTITRYPNGTLLQISNTVYLIQKGKKRAFTSRGALATNYNLNQVIPVPSIVGEQYEDGVPISYPNYSLLRNPKGTIYLLVDGKKRGIASQEVFRQFGFNPEEVIDARWSEISAIPEGKSITLNDSIPQGLLLQDSSTGAVSYIDPRGNRHDIWSRIVLENRFNSQQPTVAEKKDINAYTQSTPLKLKDGTLVRTKKGSSVFMISNGKRRAFDSRATFDQLGYQWSQITIVPPSILKIHPKGKLITL